MEAGKIDTSRRQAKDLSKVPGFDLGTLRIDPPSRRIHAGERSEMLEPRVMRVLVALGAAPGTVLSRDDLIELCWDGTIVGDNAIDRVISRLRHVLDDLAGESARLETIPRVGFRIVCDAKSVKRGIKDGSSENAAQPVRGLRVSRRTALAGLTFAAAGSGIAYFALNPTLRAGPEPRARELYERGRTLVESGDGGSVRQAMDFYKQAVTIDPNYADAWGALAVSYVHNLDTIGDRERLAAPELARSAAQRALSLDPDQPDALLALAIPLPHFRRWLDHEKKLRDLIRRYPKYWYGHAQLGILLLDVGRAGEAAERYRRVLDVEPMLPSFWVRYAGALNMAGREQEADIAFDQALGRWPTNVYIAGNRVFSYLDSKRFAEALAFLRDPRKVPENTDEEAARVLRWAEALASGTGFPEHIAFIRGRMSQAKNSDFSNYAGILLRLGAVDLAYDALEASYFGGVLDGRRIPPPDASARRSTAPLWGASVLEHRDDSRFVSILNRVGLENYWRKSGTQPDFRRR